MTETTRTCFGCGAILDPVPDRPTAMVYRCECCPDLDEEFAGLVAELQAPYLDPPRCCQAQGVIRCELGEGHAGAHRGRVLRQVPPLPGQEPLSAAYLLTPVLAVVGYLAVVWLLR